MCTLIFGVLTVKMWQEGLNGHEINRQWQPQLQRAWALLLKDSSRWNPYAQHTDFVRSSLRRVHNVSRACAQIDCIFALNQWAEGFAKTIAGTRMRERERDRLFKQKLDDRYPGSAGCAHKLVKWRADWDEAKGSVSKKTLPAYPHMAVETSEGLGHYLEYTPIGNTAVERGCLQC